MNFVLHPKYIGGLNPDLPLDAHLFHNREINKTEWDDFVRQSPQGSIYTLSWYIDAIEKEWMAVIVKSNNVWQAVMPLNIQRKFLFEYSSQPILTKYWGVLFGNSDYKNTYEEYHHKKKALNHIIRIISGRIKIFNHFFSPYFDYPLPFSWNGFSVQSRYTYFIDLTMPLVDIEKNFKRTVHSDLQRSVKENITVIESHTLDPILLLAEKNLRAGKEFIKELTGRKDIVRKIFQDALSRKMAYCLTSYNGNRDLLSSVLFLDFGNTRYYFLGLVDPQFRKNDHMTRLVYEGIKDHSSRITCFDFEGSMIEGVEAFIRSFGAKPVPYLQIKKGIGVLGH